MNKFLMLAVAAFALGMAVPAMAEEAAVTTETAVEVTTDAAAPAVEHCMDDQGVEIECPAVDEEAGADAADAAHEEMAH